MSFYVAVELVNSSLIIKLMLDCALILREQQIVLEIQLFLVDPVFY